MEICDNLNQMRRNSGRMTMQELYNMSFDAHYNLVTIHPWADGNGRMARLLMNWLQFEYGLIPSRIFAADKEDYIRALVETRDSKNLDIFRNFMTETTMRHLLSDISAFEESTETESYSDVKITTAERILQLIKENPRYSPKAMAEFLGISAKGGSLEIC